jgi:TP901 family phage tail tape measure protein
MADVNANIGVSIDTSEALAQLKALQRQISQFHSSIARSSESAALAQKSLQKNLIGSINSIGAFSAELRTVRTSAESFTNSLEKNKFSMREYFRYAGASTKTFGRLFKSEFDTIGKVAEERVKTLQTQYIKMGRNASGAMEAIAIRPTSLNMQDYGTRTAIAAQKQALFNQLMKQGTTNLLNFGKNTQWAGRQLMVGFTIPLSIVGSTATKTFMDMEAQALKFKKVYGDLFTPKAETQAALDNITELGRQFTKYGISVSQTVGLAAEAAAAGFQGLDLQRQTTEATRLSVLGQVDSQKALETTISLQNAFGMSSDKLADSINFLNAVENQTVVSLDDITTAIPKVAPVIQQLGGDVKDLTFFIAAMKEGGINASEGANALKSGLAALINPTRKASDMLANFGINAKEIVVKNKGDLKATVIEFATALNQLDPLNRAQAIEQMFGKFQFARLSTLFANVAKDGNQAARVLSLANSSVQELSDLSEQELGMTADSAMNKFKKSVEDLKFALIPVGQAFLEAATPIIEFVGGVLEKFDNLSDGTKKLITFLTVGIGAIGPIFLMTFGLIANAIANGLKGVMLLRQGYLRLTGQSQILGEQTQYLNTEQLEAAAAAHSLDQSHAKLTQRFAAETTELNKLIAAYQSATRAAQSFAFNNPGMMMPPRGGRKLASGIVSVPGPKGAGDIVPAMLSPGEAVIPAEFAKKYAPLIQGMVAGNIPGYQDGRNPSSSMGMVFAHGAAGRNLDQQTIQQLASAVSQSVARNLEQATRVKAFTNFGFVAPEKLNKGKMSGTESGQFFEQNAELATSRIYKSITSLLPSAASDPAVKQDVILFGKNIGKQLSLAGSKAVSDPEFYNAVEIALQKTMTQATTQAFKESLPKIQKQVTTIGAFGGEINRGDRGQRIGLSRKVQMQGLGYEQGMTSYKSQTLLSQLQKQGFNQGQQSLTPIDKIRAQTASTGGGANMVAGIRAGQQAKYNKQDAAILEAMGIRSARSAITATEKEAQTASPSKRTRRIGQDIARGLEVGMADRQDDVARAGNNLSNAAVGGTQKGRRSATRPQGAPTISQVAANAPMSPQINAKVKEQARNIKLSSDRLAGLNNKIMGGTFALTSLAGVASMAGGNLGKLSGIVFQLSGVMFALSTVLNILPNKFKTFLFNLKPGPALLFTAALAAGVGIIKLINNAREKERMAIEGVGKAANLTSTQIEKLGGVLGFTPVKSNLELSKPAVSGLTIEKSQQVEETRKLLAEDKDFKDQITALKNATNEQADIIFKSLALRLTGQGATKEQITNYIYALQQEAGKTNVKFDLKSIDLSTKEGQAGLQNSVNTLLKDYKTAFDKGYKTTKVQSRTTGQIIEIGTASDELKTKLSTTANVISNTFMSLDTQLRSGKISADQFNQSFDNISTSINEMPKAEGLFLMGELLKTLPSELVKSASGLKETANQLLIIKAAALGVAVSTEMIQALLIAETDKSADSQIRASTIKAELERKMKVAQKVISSLVTKDYVDVGENAKSAKESSDSRLSVISNFFNAQEALIKQNRKSGEDAAQAAIDQSEAKVKAIEKEIDAQQLLVDANQRQVDLLNRRIELEFDRPIQKLQDESTILSNNLDIIRKQEDAINSQYDKQIESLEKISLINQEIAGQEKSRLTIADALTSGDIAAAAAAVQDARAQAAASRIEQQTKALEASRQQALSGIVAGGMTKDQIEARTYQIGQQTFLLEQQRKVVQNEITTLQDKNYILEQGIYSIKQTSLIPAQAQVDKAKLALDEYNKQTDSIVKSITYLGKTQTEWDAVKVRVEAANSAVDLTELGLKKASALTSQIFKDWDAIKSKTITITTNYVTGPNAALLNPTTQTSAFRSRMYGGKILPMAMGGMVPKYMMAGGGVGSDTVPAMLTPGEFVMNKQATKSFGPLLSMLNESKYPSMIGSSYDGKGSSGGIMTSVSDNSSKVYNYNVGITVPQSNANPNDIARAVIGQIKYIDNQRIRGQR